MTILPKRVYNNIVHHTTDQKESDSLKVVKRLYDDDLRRTNLIK